MPRTNNLRIPKSVTFGRPVTESENSFSKIQATGTMREAFPPSLPSGSPDLEKKHHKLIEQTSIHHSDVLKTVDLDIESSSKRDSTDLTNTLDQLQLPKKTTINHLGQSPHHHRTSSPIPKYSSYSSPTSETKTLPDQGIFVHCNVIFSVFSLF